MNKLIIACTLLITLSRVLEDLGSACFLSEVKKEIVEKAYNEYLTRSIGYCDFLEILELIDCKIQYTALEGCVVIDMSFNIVITHLWGYSNNGE